MESKADIRRKKLAQWFMDRSYPEKDRSYISQLINNPGSSFGEKAARRLEKECGMPAGFLDQEEGSAGLAPVPPAPAPEAGLNDAIELLALFQAATVEGRKAILDTARAAGDLADGIWRRINGNQR